MPSTHLYPDPSDPNPRFMLGHFDLEDADRGSLLDFGEAVLGVQERHRRFIGATPSHHRRGTTNEGTGWFLFGVVAEQPLVAFPDDLILNLWATEQA